MRTRRPRTRALGSRARASRPAPCVSNLKVGRQGVTRRGNHMRKTWLIPLLLISPALFFPAPGAASGGEATFVPVLLAEDVDRVGTMHSLLASDGGVDVGIGERILHVSYEGHATLVPGTFPGRAEARDAAGAYYVSDDWRTRRHEDGESTLVAQRVRHATFGPDRLLYGCPTEWPRHLVAIAQDRSVRTLDVPCEGPLAFAPDARLGHLAERAPASLWLTDVGTGVSTVIPTGVSANALAFGADGLAYVGTWTADGAIVAIDPATGSKTRIGAAPGGILDMAFSGTRLYVIHANQTPHGALGYFDLGVEGFAAHRPAFRPPPLPDLAVRGIRFASDDDRMLVTVEVANVGHADVGQAASLRLWRTTGSCGGYRCPSVDVGRTAWDETIPPLAAGGSANVTFDWSGVYVPGTHHFDAYVRLPGDPPNAEEDDRNNHRHARSHYLVGTWP